MKPLTFAYESMGTHWEISIWDKIEENELNKINSEIQKESENFDQTYSRFISSSFVSQLAQKKGIIHVPKDFIDMLKLYFRYYNLSGKKFTPLVGQALSDMGYDKAYSLQRKKEITLIPDLDDVVTILNETTIELKHASLFDFGALGKGYFVEKIKDKLFALGYKHFLVNGSGDIAYISPGMPISVGLEHPLDTSKVIGTVEFHQGAMCSSGTNRRAWGEYHHIIDPQTRASASGILASWVIADTATNADALATALFLSPPESFTHDFRFEYLLLNKDMKIKRSPGFTAQLF